MDDTLRFADLSPYVGELSAGDHEWLTQAARVDPRKFRVGVAGGRPGDNEWLPLVERGTDGRWRAGRFIGSMTIGGRQLVIVPRLGISTVEAWLDQAFGLAAPPASARHDKADVFIARLLARLWCRAVDNATRIGLPLLRLPREHQGLYVRGRLDTPRTLRLRSRGEPYAASVTHDRSLDHPASRALVRAERALSERLAGAGEWRTDRVRQVLPHMRAVVGSRPRLPSASELERVRYTPITLPFRQAALLSHQIASRLGYTATDQPGVAEGLLVDVAELWELFVLNCARRTVPAGLRVEHGTTAGRRDHLLRSGTSGAGMGRLKPDVLILHGDRVAAVIDAKYKRLAASRERPNGVDQADLYQLAAYASRYQPERTAALVYPCDRDGQTALAETGGPWHGTGTTFLFSHLATEPVACTIQLAALMGALADRRPTGAISPS